MEEMILLEECPICRGAGMATMINEGTAADQQRVHEDAIEGSGFLEFH